jgi:hypothetical protein
VSSSRVHEGTKRGVMTGLTRSSPSDSICIEDNNEDDFLVITEFAKSSNIMCIVCTLRQFFEYIKNSFSKIKDQGHRCNL